MTRFAIPIGAILIPGAAAAHPEHVSGGNFSLVHYVTDPFHLSLAGVAVLLVIAARRWAPRVGAGGGAAR